MTEKVFKRKLTAILSADVEGYSRLMGEDEGATVRTLTAYREVMTTLIQQHDGRVIDSPGDNLLAEFASVVDALRCAWDVQQELANKNAELPKNRRMHLRIGINLGDVIEEEGRIYGDGVNIAARLESLAEPDGIHLSGAVYDQVKNKLPYRFEFAGKQQVKNIRDPIRTYRVVMESSTPYSQIRTEAKNRKHSRTGMLIILAAIAILATGLYHWVNMHKRSLSSKPPASKLEPHRLSQRASIAVLPFENLSGDSEHEYFSDGITNDLITALSKFRELLVIASNTIFAYKGKSVNIELIGQELNVKYVLEGSVQKVADKVRVNAQLIDATTGFHIWAERYDRELNDIFAVQDEIVQTIIGKLAVKIDAVERKHVMHKKTESLKAYDYLLRGMVHYRRRTLSDNIKARHMFEKAIELDPEFASAYIGLGKTYKLQVDYGWTEFPTQTLQRAKELALKALSLEESLADAYSLLGNVHIYFGRYDLAINQLNRAIKLNPNDASSYNIRGEVMLWSGKVDEAIRSLETALLFDPNNPSGIYMFLGICYYLKGHYDKAINVLEDGLIRRPDWVGNHIILAAVYAQSNRLADAEREAKEVLRLEPYFKIDNYGTVFRNEGDRAKIVQGLRKAGLN